MATHSLTIEISDVAYRSLKRRIDSGRYATVDEVIEDALLDEALGAGNSEPAAGKAYEEWLHAEAIDAYDEHAAKPEETYTSQQVLAYLAEERGRDKSAG